LTPVYLSTHMELAARVSSRIHRRSTGSLSQAERAALAQPCVSHNHGVAIGLTGAETAIFVPERSAQLGSPDADSVTSTTIVTNGDSPAAAFVRHELLKGETLTAIAGQKRDLGPFCPADQAARRVWGRFSAGRARDWDRR
jgi:hypothetical protein